MRVAIVGYGVVGRGMERLFRDRFEVVIYDPAKGYGDRASVNESDLAVICVPTNQLPSGAADTSAVEQVASWIQTPLVLIKSTVPPGTTDALSARYGKQIHFSPEYMGESKYFTPPWKYPDPADARSHAFCIIGGPQASDIAAFFMKCMSVDTVYALVSNVEAELTKYMENAFFATKVTFCNEFARIAQAFGVDYKKLRETWLLDPRINRNHTLVFEDEPGYGGKCLPKDIAAIVSAAKGAGYVPTLLQAVIDANERIKDRRDHSPAKGFQLEVPIGART